MLRADSRRSNLLGQPGTYLLVIHTRLRLELSVGHLGGRVFLAGWHIYVGSAQRGLSGRLKHHLSPDAAVRWHIDYLRRTGRLVEVWVQTGRERRECALAQAIASLPGAERSPRFGSSDCHCPGHLVSFRVKPRLSTVCPGLVRLSCSSIVRPTQAN